MTSTPDLPAPLLAIAASIADAVLLRIGAPAWYRDDDSPLDRATFVQVACIDKEVRAHRVGRRIFVRREDLDAWISAQPAPGAPPRQKPRKRVAK